MSTWSISFISECDTLNESRTLNCLLIGRYTEQRSELHFYLIEFFTPPHAGWSTLKLLPVRYDHTA